MRKSWSTQEVRLLLRSWGKDDAAALGIATERSPASIRGKTRRLGLSESVRQSTHSISRSRRSKTVNATFFDGEPSGTLFYLLGFVHAAGRIKHRHRHVLKLRVQRVKESDLRHILELLDSCHGIQEIDGNLVVEVCNKYLVESLIRRWGPVPSKANPDPDCPKVGDAFLRSYALGHLSATGLVHSGLVRWTGTRKIVNGLSGEIQRKLGLNPPRVVESLGATHASWAESNAVQKIQSFLTKAIGP